MDGHGPTRAPPPADPALAPGAEDPPARRDRLPDPGGLSYVRAMGEKHNVGLGVRSVEWLRQTRWQLARLPDRELVLHPERARKGRPAAALPTPGRGGRRRAKAESGDAAYRPPDVKPLIRPALPGEGVWKKAAAEAGPRPPVLLTTFRSDPEYPQFVAGVAWIDSSRTRLAYVPGLAEPPPPLAHRGPAEVPPKPSASGVVATFNGGFPLETSNAGLIYRGKVRETMVNGIATVVEYRDGRVDIVRWNRGRGRRRTSGSRSRTCRRSSTKAGSTRTSATVRPGVKPSTTRSGSGARASASTAAATCSTRRRTTRRSNRWRRSCSVPAPSGRSSSTSTKTGPASSATATRAPANRATCCRK